MASVRLAALFGLLACCLPLAAQEESGSAMRLHLVPVAKGLVQCSFADDPARFRTTGVYKGAGSVGCDLLNPPNPLWCEKCRDGRLFYVFYNVVTRVPGSAPWLIQRVERTVTNYPADGGKPEVQTTYLVEAFKTRRNTTKRPDEHYGKFTLGRHGRREIVKKLEVGVGGIGGVASGRSWPFGRRTLYKGVQPYQSEIGAYSRVQFDDSVTYTIRVVLEADDRYAVEVPELDIAVGTGVSSTPDGSGDAAASSPLMPNALPAADLELAPGKGVAGIVIDKHDAADVERVFGKPAATKRAGAKAANQEHAVGLVFNIREGGPVNTIDTLPGFAGKTDRGIRLGDSLDDVVAAHGKPNSRSKTFVSYDAGMGFLLDADREVKRIVVFARK